MSQVLFAHLADTIMNAGLTLQVNYAKHAWMKYATMYKLPEKKYSESHIFIYLLCFSCFFCTWSVVLLDILFLEWEDSEKSYVLQKAFNKLIGEKADITSIYILSSTWKIYVLVDGINMSSYELKHFIIDAEHADYVLMT